MFLFAKAPRPLTVEALMVIDPLFMALFFLRKMPIVMPATIPDMRQSGLMTIRFASIGYCKWSDAIRVTTAKCNIFSDFVKVREQDCCPVFRE
jgi:hypothetical protein